LIPGIEDREKATAMTNVLNALRAKLLAAQAAAQAPVKQTLAAAQAAVDAYTPEYKNLQNIYTKNYDDCKNVEDSLNLAAVSKCGNTNWIHVGGIEQYDELRNKYPFDRYEWGGTYNLVQPQPLVISHWNLGIRIAFRTMGYPAGDANAGMQAGNAIFTRGVSDEGTCPNNGFRHYYYKLTNNNGMFYTRIDGWSNGCGGLRIYVREKKFVQIGSINLLWEAMKTKPVDQYTYYGTYNNANPQPLQINSWNTGFRVSFLWPYLQGDNSRQFTLGNAMFNQGMTDEADKSAWRHNYVTYNSDGALKNYWTNGHAGLTIWAISNECDLQ
jgi:hypothetical protein